MNDHQVRTDPTVSKWLVMFAVSIGSFMSTLDASIVNISLPSISTRIFDAVSARKNGEK